MNYTDEDRTKKYLMLSHIKGIGSVSQNALLDICGDIESCFEIGYEELVRADRNLSVRIGEKRIGIFVSQRKAPDLRFRAEEIMKSSEDAGINIITRDDIRYPDRFRSISDMPVILFSKGELMINEFVSSVGIVGARRCTSEGKTRAIGIAQKAVENNAAVISGMAKGIDSYAHTAALKSQGYTIAVLGNGADICYPQEHIRLYSEIGDRGCILSEYPPGTAPRQYCFPNRNRLIAALSDELYVVEAGRHSGTESTVDSGKKYGKEVMNL